MKDSVSCERVSVPSALLLHCYYSAQYKSSSAALLPTFGAMHYSASNFYIYISKLHSELEEIASAT